MSGERARAVLEHEAIASGDFGAISFSDPVRNPWAVAERAMLAYADERAAQARTAALREAAAIADAEAADIEQHADLARDPWQVGRLGMAMAIGAGIRGLIDLTELTAAGDKVGVGEGQ